MGDSVYTSLNDILKEFAGAAATYAYPRWLKLKPAAQYSGIGQKRLISLAESGEVVGFQDPDSGRGDWVFDRISIDAYRLSQAPGLNPEEKARMILNGERI